MAINLGSTAIADAKLGTTQVEKIYLGSEQVWGRSPTPTDPQYGEVVLYGYTVTQTVIDNVTGGDVEVKDEAIVRDVLFSVTPPITITIEGDDVEVPWDWQVTTDQPGAWVDPWMLSEAFSITAPSNPFTITFTLESIASISIDKTTTSVRTVASVAEFNEYNYPDDGSFMMENNIPVEAVKEFRVGSQIISIPDNFLRGAVNLDDFSFSTNSNLTTIGNQFLQSCNTINCPMNIPVDVTTIGDNFLSNADSFNNMLTLPNTLTSIGASFLVSARAFNQPIVLPSTLTSIGANFLFYMGNMTSYVDVGSLDASIIVYSQYAFSAINQAAPAYTTGIPIKGANRAAWRNKFPNKTSYPYRKLIDGGE